MDQPTKFRVRIYCPDCTGEDMGGCFDGGTKLLDDIFETREQAEKAGDEYVDDSIWNYEIEEERSKSEGR